MRSTSISAGCWVINPLPCCSHCSPALPPLAATLAAPPDTSTRDLSRCRRALQTYRQLSLLPFSPSLRPPTRRICLAYVPGNATNLSQWFRRRSSAAAALAPCTSISARQIPSASRPTTTHPPSHVALCPTTKLRQSP